CYVRDLVEGIYRLLTVPSDDPLIVNLGNPEEVTVRDLALEILGVTGSKSAIVYRPLPQDDPRIRRPDIRVARELLGWSPTVSRREGLRQVLPHFQKAVRQLQIARSDGAEEVSAAHGRVAPLPATFI